MARNLCLFAHFDANGRVEPYVFRYVEAIRSCGFDVVFITTATIPDKEIVALSRFCLDVICRPNNGMDFGSWVAGYAKYGHNLEGELLLANDSVYGPIGNLDIALKRLRTLPGDIRGMVESLELERHIQSWFVLLSPSAHRSAPFRAMMAQDFTKLSKDKIIVKGEIELSSRLRAAGLSGTALFSLAHRERDGAIVRYNPCHLIWKEMIEIFGVPFIKVELLRDNPWLISNLSEWRAVLRPRAPELIPMIETHLSRSTRSNARASGIARRLFSTREVFVRRDVRLDLSGKRIKRALNRCIFSFMKFCFVSVSLAVAFILRQTAKIRERPSRVFTYPLKYCAARLMRRFPLLIANTLSILPNGWLARAVGKSFYFGIGHNILQHDRPAEAWPWLERGLQMGSPTIDNYLLGAMCLYHGLGRFRDAMSLLTRANELGLKEIERRGLSDKSFRVLDSVWARHIGHTATIDYVIKLGILEGRNREDTMLYLPTRSPVANPSLLGQVVAHLRLVEDAADLPFDVSDVQALHYDYLAPRLPDRTTEYFWELAAKTYKRWQAEGKGPLLRLPPEIETRGWEALHGAGLPQGGWFVALHVREGKWDGRDAGLHGILNSNISTYLPAINEITRRGGWVIRMGDPGMTRLPQLPNVYDYCHSNLRADWMDIFIATRCRFMLGSASGPALLPPIYGVPVILTNWWPPAQRPWHASDIFIPKLIRKSMDGRCLTLSETLREPFAWCHSRRYLADHEGVRVEEIDPETIKAAVEEMFARLNGDLSQDADVANMRLRADQIYESQGISGMAQLASGFLRRHGDVIA